MQRIFRSNVGEKKQAQLIALKEQIKQQMTTVELARLQLSEVDNSVAVADLTAALSLIVVLNWYPLTILAGTTLVSYLAWPSVRKETQDNYHHELKNLLSLYHDYSNLFITNEQETDKTKLQFDVAITDDETYLLLFNALSKRMPWDKLNLWKNDQAVSLDKFSKSFCFIYAANYKSSFNPLQAQDTISLNSQITMWKQRKQFGLDETAPKTDAVVGANSAIDDYVFMKMGKELVRKFM